MRKAFILAAASILFLAACTSNPDETPQPAPEVVESNDPVPVEPELVETEETELEPQTPEHVAPIIPECEILAPIHEVHEAMSDRFDYVTDLSWVNDRLIMKMGPAALSAFDERTQEQFCVWAIPDSEGITSVWAAAIPDEAREIFLSELRDSAFTETKVDGLPTFAWKYESVTGPSFLWYGFTEDFVVLADAFTNEGAVGPVALRTLQALR